MNTENLSDAIDIVRHNGRDRDAQLLRLLDAMIDRVAQIEARLDRLSDLTVGSDEQPFEERVLEALEVRSGSAREALSLDDQDVERWVLSVIEENSGTVFAHIEAEIEEKNAGFLESYAFAEAVEEAVKGSIVNTVEQAVEELVFIDPEDIVRKGLRCIL